MMPGQMKTIAFDNSRLTDLAGFSYSYSRLVNLSLVMLVLMLLNACATTENSKAFRIADVNLKLGIGYFRQGRLDDSLKVLRKALDAKYDYADVHSVLAMVYEKMFMVDEAEDFYRSAIDLQSDKGGVYNNYGGFLCRQKKYADADYYFRKALQFPRYESPEQVYENAGLCQARVPDVKKAEQYFRKALDINPRLSRALLGMAKIMFEKKSFLSTRAYLQRYEQVSKHNSQSLLIGINVERNLGDSTAANRYAKQLRSEFPDSAEFKQWLNEASQGETTP